MLRTAQTVGLDSFLEELRAYVHQLLGVTLDFDTHPQVRGMPAYLAERYAFVSARLFDRPFLFMIPREEAGDTPGAVAKHRDQVRRHVTEELIVYAAPAMSAHHRHRLIAHRVSFVVPGNQLFVPEFAMDLREHFRRERREPLEALTPAAQLVILAALLDQPIEHQTPTTLAARYGYTQMSMGRVVEELRAVGLAEVEDAGKFRYITIPATGRDLWEIALPKLRSPVRKRRRIPCPPPGFRSLLAGASALAHLTDLGEPSTEVRAISAADWKVLAKNYGLDRPARWNEPTIELETWSYTPWALASQGAVDPLSLWLSLPNSSDERAQMAKDALLTAASL